MTCADLSLAGKAVIPSVPLTQVAKPPLALAPLVARPPAGPLFHLAAEDPVKGQARAIAKPPVPAQWGIAMTLERDFDLTSLKSTALARKLFWEAVAREPAILPGLLERRSVAAVLKFRSGTTVVNGALRSPPGATDPLELAVLATPRPIVFPARRVARIAGHAGWVEGVLRAGEGVATTVVLDADSAHGLPERPSPAEIGALAVWPGRIAFDVDARGPSASVLAVNQTWDEGWKLFVDGVEERLLLSDVSLSAIAVRPGRHHVELVYGDPWVVAGLLASGGALLALAATLLVPCLLSRFGGPRLHRLHFPR